MLQKLLFPEVEGMKLLSSNLLKRNWIQVQSDDTIVINNNELLGKRLRDLGLEPLPSEKGEEKQEGFRSGLGAEELTGLTSEGEGDSSVIKAEPPAPPEPVYEGPSPEELIAQAQAEIAQMKEAAQAEIVAAKQQAAEEGWQEGLNQGYREGAASAEAELADARARMEAEYNDKMRQLEPEFVKQLTAIYEQVFHIELGDYQNLVLRLLEGCMQKMETSSNYIIHVGPEDYPFVSMQKKVLMEVMGNKNAALEIVEDATMKKNECMIEADSGIYDCSLDMQLAALRRELLLLSYEGVE